MSTDREDLERGYGYFFAEAEELLQALEQDLLALREERTPARVHGLMRAAHTLKGASASVELNGIRDIAHWLEDVFKSLYNPEIVLDDELESLLFEAYACLRLVVNRQSVAVGDAGDDREASLLQRQADDIFERLREKLGDRFDPDAEIPDSVALGFDVVKSVFEIGVRQRLEELEAAVRAADPARVRELLVAHAQTFAGLGESLELPGFGDISRLVLAATEWNPDKVMRVAEVALANLWQAVQVVMEGDRDRGGEPSPDLEELAKPPTESATVSPPKTPKETRSEPQSETPVVSETVLENPPEAIAPPSLDDVFGDFDLDEPATVRANDARESNGRDAARDNDREHAFADISLEDLELPEEPPVAVGDGEDFIDVWDLSAAPTAAVPEEPSEDLPEGMEEIAISQREDDAPRAGFASTKPSERDRAQKEEFGQFAETDREPPATVPARHAVSPQPSVSPPTIEPQRTVPAAVAPAPAAVAPAPAAPSPTKRSEVAPTVRVDLEQLERLNFQAGELLVGQNKQVVQNEKLAAAVEQLRSHLQQHYTALSQVQFLFDRLAEEWKARRNGRATLAVSRRGVREASQTDRVRQLLQATQAQMAWLQESCEAIDTCAKESQQTLDKQQRLLTEVRDDLTNTRMQPLGDILKRFPRPIEQLAKKHGKPVELHVEGDRVLADKKIVQALYYPLLHLVRNAFDHGIESPEERQRAGKPATGRIELRAYNKGNRTIIEVRDDGRGLDFARIRQRVADRNLVGPDRAIELTEDELVQFLFQPGFSTADRVSDLSGRGVGLDVVRSQLQEIEARVTVRSEPRKGTTFYLRLPISLSIAKLLVVYDGGVSYAFPSDSVEQIILPLARQIQHLGDGKILQWRSSGREETLPVRRLSDLARYAKTPVFRPEETPVAFGKSSLASNTNGNNPSEPYAERANRTLPPSAPERHDDGPAVQTYAGVMLLLRSQGKLVALEVERVLGEQELAVRPLGSAIAPPSYVYGCTILGDSRLALVIDAIVLIERSLQPPSTAALPPAATIEVPSIAAARDANVPRLAPAAQNGSTDPNGSIALHEKTRVTVRRGCILIADDSLTLRHRLGQNLESWGYETVRAEDGADAIAKLRQNPKIDAIVSDLEMPNTNGFEFLRLCQADPQLARIPFIMLTSHRGKENAEIARGLGAKVYLSKPHNETELLELLENLIGTSRSPI